MSTTDEEMYLQLHAKFQEELTLVEQQIIDLQDRRDQLTSLLSGAGPATVVFTPEEDPDEVETPDPIFRKEKTENNPEQRGRIDGQLVGFVRKNPGANRSEINKGLAPKGWSSWDVDKSLKRCKNAGKIKRSGETRSASWYVNEETK
jgi:predicted HTH transcriptional regulator